MAGTSGTGGGGARPPPPRRVEDAFGSIAAGYDAWVRMALPTYDELFRVAVEAIPHPAEAAIEVADLGAGSGLFAAHVARARPRASLALYDASPEMLERARRRFAEGGDRVTFAVERLEDFAAPGRFDLVISSLAIHHLPDEAKRSLFRRIFESLRPGGAFVNVDQVRGEGRFADLYRRTWLARLREAGAPEEEIRASLARRRAFDRDAALGDQLAWLADAGFQADCLYKHYFVAVFLGLKG